MIAQVSGVAGRAAQGERDRPVIEGWSPEQYDELAGLLTRLARELVGEPSRELQPAQG
jgi:hypothetical protein